MLGISIERDEAIQIIISVLSISLALGIVFAEPSGILRYPREFVFFLLPLLVTVGSGFILHEMGHKLLAMYYGAGARFQMWIQGLVVMLVTSVFGFLFAAPGAVYIDPVVDKRQYGLISLVGPLINFALVIVFIALQFIAPVNQYYSFLLGQIGLSSIGIVRGTLEVWRFGAAMNLMLALFNMIPAFPLDGSKVFRWNVGIWFAVVILFLVLGSIIISPAIVISWGLMVLILGIISKLLFG